MCKVMSSELMTSTNLWNIIWQSFENASLTYDLASSQNGTKSYNPESNIIFDPAKLGIVTGLLLAWLAETHIFPNAKVIHNAESYLKTLLIVVFNVTCFVLIAPWVALILSCFSIYRVIVHFVLQSSLGEDFEGLLEGTDSVWAIEDAAALSVINVFAVLELDPLKSGENVLDDFRDLVNNRLLNADFEKLSWHRENKYGYYFWKRADRLDMEKQVRWLDEEHEECDGTCNDIYGGPLKRKLTEVTNKPLPEDHKTGWEILIGRNCPCSRISKSPDQLPGRRTLPLLFRVHHSLGDGVALLRLLLEAIADTNNSEVKEDIESSGLEENDLNKNENFHRLHIPQLRDISSPADEANDYSSDVIYYSADMLDALMPFAIIFPVFTILQSFTTRLFTSIMEYKAEELQGTIRGMYEKIIAFFTQVLHRIKKAIITFETNLITLTLIPTSLVSQALRSMDNSAIHGPILTGNKIISCWMEDDFKNSQDYNLLAKIRDIKNVTGAKFSDVILAAMSASLQKYFCQVKEVAPKKLTVVIPARMTVPTPKLALKNQFSVGLLPLCISEVNGVHCEYADDLSQLLSRICDVSLSAQKLRRDPDYLVNYWVMTWLCAILPEFVLRPILQSHSTMVFSNLPGPQLVSIQGHVLKKIAFWIPHRGTTGIGCSFLTYGANCHLSMIADKAVIANENLLDQILQGTVRYIEQLHDNISSGRQIY